MIVHYYHPEFLTWLLNDNDNKGLGPSRTLCGYDNEGRCRTITGDEGVTCDACILLNLASNASGT